MNGQSLRDDKRRRNGVNKLHRAAREGALIARINELEKRVKALEDLNYRLHGIQPESFR